MSSASNQIVQREKDLDIVVTRMHPIRYSAIVVVVSNRSNSRSCTTSICRIFTANGTSKPQSNQLNIKNVYRIYDMKDASDYVKLEYGLVQDIMTETAPYVGIYSASLGNYSGPIGMFNFKCYFCANLLYRMGNFLSTVAVGAI